MAMYPTLNLPPQGLHVLNLARREAVNQGLYWREPSIKWDESACGLLWRGTHELLVLVNGPSLSTYRPGRTKNGPQVETMGDTVASILWAVEGEEGDVEPG